MKSLLVPKNNLITGLNTFSGSPTVQFRSLLPN